MVIEPVTVGRAERTDDEARALTSLHHRAALRAYAGIFPSDAPKPSFENDFAEWRQWLQQDFAEGIHAYVAKTSIGDCIGVVVAGTDPDEPSTGHLARFYVDPDHWGRGVGTQLYGAAVADLASRFREATLWVLEDGARARAWYERLGWRLTPKRKMVYAPAGIEDVHYRIDLRDRPFEDIATACWLDPRAELRRSDIEGSGLFATEEIPARTPVSRLGGRVVSGAELQRLMAARDADPSLPYVDTITLGDDAHLVLPPDQPNHYGNHSCDPNLWWDGPFTLVARRTIARFTHDQCLDEPTMAAMSEQVDRMVASMPDLFGRPRDTNKSSTASSAMSPRARCPTERRSRSNRSASWAPIWLAWSC